MFKYNAKYKNIFYEGENRRLYNELTTTSLDALYSETQIKLIEFIEKWDFDVFYFTCSPKTNDKILINDYTKHFKGLKLEKKNVLNIYNSGVINIKNNQKEDLMYLYKNCIFEVIYTFPIVTENNNYYFNFILVVNKNFNLNSLYNHDFNLIKIENVKKLYKEDISFDYIKKLFEQRTILNDTAFSLSIREYKFNEMSSDEYIKKYKNGDENLYDFDEYRLISSEYFHKNHNEYLYLNDCFRFLSVQIWSLDRVFYKKKVKLGIKCSYNEIYDINSGFITNYAEIIGIKSVEVSENKNYILNDIEYTYSSLRDNFHDQDIVEGSLSKEFARNGFIEFDKIKIT